VHIWLSADTTHRLWHHSFRTVLKTLLTSVPPGDPTEPKQNWNHVVWIITIIMRTHGVWKKCRNWKCQCSASRLRVKSRSTSRRPAWHARLRHKDNTSMLLSATMSSTWSPPTWSWRYCQLGCCISVNPVVKRSRSQLRKLSRLLVTMSRILHTIHRCATYSRCRRGSAICMSIRLPMFSS